MRSAGAAARHRASSHTNPANDALRRRLQGVFGSGYGYAYLYPGIRKVVQAAGRVTQTPEDKGVVYLNRRPLQPSCAPCAVARVVAAGDTT